MNRTTKYYSPRFGNISIPTDEEVASIRRFAEKAPVTLLLELDRKLGAMGLRLKIEAEEAV